MQRVSRDPEFVCGSSVVIMMHIESMPFFVEGPALAGNFTAAFCSAQPLAGDSVVIAGPQQSADGRPPCGNHYVDLGVAPLELDEGRFAAARAYLAQEINSPEFTSSTSGPSPYSNDGIFARIEQVLRAVAPSHKEELERLAGLEYERAHAAHSRKLVAATEGASATSPEIMDQAATLAAADKAAWLRAARELPLASVVELVQLMAKRFEASGGLTTAARVLFAAIQEVTHASLSCVNFNGMDIPYGAAGIVRASPDSARCPSIYHASRGPAFAYVREKWATGEIQRALGIPTAESGRQPSAVFMPGVPPF